ncbi:MAG: DUF1636 domain-containing protein [Rhodobacteraceae bacterium]|nr:DUF1636 domain-containing protein [Paracoccaceae bacterium]
MKGVAVTLCRSCPDGQEGLAGRLRAALGDAVAFREVDCMSGCTRPVTVAFRAEGKTAYLFGDITVADIPNLVTFLRLYAGSVDGDLADARPLGPLRGKAIARIPG